MQTISNGTNVSISSGSGVASGDIVLSGGTLDVLAGGIATGTILSGGTENVAGTEQSATISRVGDLNVLSGGKAHDISVSSGGTLGVAGTVTSDTIVYTSGIENISSGGWATGSAGSGTKISGGTVNVLSGGELDHSTVFQGGILNVAGTVLSNVVISSGGTENISSGGLTEGTTGTGTGVSSGGKLNVLAGGSASHITVSNGGILNVAGTIVSNVIVAAGGTEIISSGGVVTGETGSGTAVSGTVSVLLAGEFDHFSIFEGGTVSVFSGAEVHNISISGGTLDIAGSLTSNATIFDGGTVDVLSGGDAQNFLVATGGTLYVESSGTAEFFTLSGGSATVFSGGIVHDLTVSSGGTLNLFGTAASNSFIASGGVENVSSGGVETGTVQGTVNIFSGGSITFTGVEIDGQLEVSAGGLAQNNLVLGGEEDVFGLATSTTLLSAIDTISGSPTSGQAFAGTERVFSGGVANATTVGDGGELVVSSGGTASNTNVQSGGTLEVVQGGQLTGGGFTLVEQASSGTTLDGPVAVSGTSGTVIIGPGGLPIIGGTLDFGGAPSQLENFVISGFDDGDTLDLTSVNYVSAGASANLLAGNELELKVNGVTYDFQLNTNQNFTGEFFHVTSDSNGHTDIIEDMSPCYCPGTLITTDRGEIAVEQLAIGDTVITMSGKTRPIKWIGRRSYSGRFAIGQKHILPVCIQAGALGDNVPRRDLWISPQHAMYLQGLLIEAKDLVNDLSIVQASKVDSITYIHIELDTHDVIVAEGSFSETFVDDNSRGMFHNADEYRRIHADEPRRTARYYAPRLRDGYQVEAARRHIDALAGLRQDAPATASLLGFVEVVTPKLISGWAQNPEHPAVPVCLEIVADGLVIGEVLANFYRQDLEHAGLGDGRHGFAFTPPLAKTFRHVEVRRALDGAELPRAATSALSVKVTQSRKRASKRSAAKPSRLIDDGRTIRLPSERSPDRLTFQTSRKSSLVPSMRSTVRRPVA